MARDNDNLVCYTIMRRDHKTGESVAFDDVTAMSRAEAKSKFHMRRSIYDTDKFSYWVAYPVMR